MAIHDNHMITRGKTLLLHDRHVYIMCPLLYVSRLFQQGLTLSFVFIEKYHWMVLELIEISLLYHLLEAVRLIQKKTHLQKKHLNLVCSPYIIVLDKIFQILHSIISDTFQYCLIKLSSLKFTYVFNAQISASNRNIKP